MLLYLGNRPTLVVSSAHAAQEILKTHDVIFANRSKLRFINKIFYDGNDIGFNSYGEKWRHMRAICVMQLLNNKRIQSFRPIREEEVALVIEKIRSYSGADFNLGEAFATHVKDLIWRVALGRKYTGDDETRTDFYKLFKLTMEVMGESSVGDYIPFLCWVDRLTGLEGRAEFVRKQFDKFIEEVLDEHQKENQKFTDDIDDKGQNFVDVLLQLQRENPEEHSRENIKAIILDMLVAGTDTTTTTLEWAMTELIRHPRVMKKLQEEVREIAKTKTRVTEDDLEKMQYLKAVIKEALRLHPAAPLLIFRESSQDVKLDKYDITAKTQVIVNALAIQRDPKLWQDPEDFHPERFLNNSSTVDYKGQHFKYIPFGAGRRGCPGLSFSIAAMELLIANLVYEFNWTLPDGRECETLDVEESAGITVGRRNPLMVIATPTV